MSIYELPMIIYNLISWFDFFFDISFKTLMSYMIKI